MRRYAYLIAASSSVAAIAFILLELPALVIAAQVGIWTFLVIGYRERAAQARGKEHT